MARVNELPEDKVQVGLRLRSLASPNKLGTIVLVDLEDDGARWIKWDGDETGYMSCFYGNDCDCEVAHENL